MGEFWHVRYSAARMAYLFDLDGTLIDSEDAHKSAEAETFRTLGYDFSEADLFPFTGVPYKTMLATIAPSLTLEAFWAAHKPRLLGLIGTRIVPFPDVDECLQGISGNPSMIVTSSPRWYVEEFSMPFPFSAQPLGLTFVRTISPTASRIPSHSKPPLHR